METGLQVAVVVLRAGGVEMFAGVRSAWSVPALDRAKVRDALGLTETEGEVVVLLAEGRAVPEIAILRERTAESLRWHLKQVFTKTGLRRESRHGPCGARGCGITGPGPAGWSRSPV